MISKLVVKEIAGIRDGHLLFLFLVDSYLIITSAPRAVANLSNVLS